MAAKLAYAGKAGRDEGHGAVDGRVRWPDIIAAIDPQDYDVIADLDELLTTDENNLWDEDTQTL